MYQDGQTATNPQTGEKVVLRGGQWVPAGGVAPAPTPGAPDRIMGAPKPVDPLDMEYRQGQIASQRRDAE